MPVQYIRQGRNRRVSRNVPRHLREFVAQGQAQLKFQIIAHSVVVLLQAACLALPRVLAAQTSDVVSRLGAYSRTLSAMASSVSSSRTISALIASALVSVGRPSMPNGVVVLTAGTLLRHLSTVCFGSLADIGARISDVRFTPANGHSERQHRRPLSAKS